ncbi:GGDEF domain-containing protein [Derxia gummosa]|uniref:GGDEF domain-containing protein n=1 Tax=Derxia gummosa DSM 723 TaxID=1121388 RepID=A0A8B6XAQ3_9BURK|nr:response regulator [Derxia gummosa]
MANSAFPSVIDTFPAVAEARPPQAPGDVRILIVDDSRLVRASIINHLKGVFDHVEANDGEAAWALLNEDPSIRVVISDLAMPRLDGYGLLDRIRNSPEARIRRTPVVILSGDEEEAARAAALGATEFITKGVLTVELIARLQVLVRLSQQWSEIESAQAQPVMTEGVTGLASRAYFEAQADKMWAFSRRHGIDFIVMCVRLDDIRGLAPEHAGVRGAITERVFGFIAEMLNKAVRTEDCVTRAGDNEFIVGTMGISPTGAVKFAQRLSQAIARARVTHGGHELTVTASFGVAAASQSQVQTPDGLREIAVRRALVAQRSGGNRVIGMAEESLEQGAPVAADDFGLPPMTIAEALNLIARGREREVLPYLPLLSTQIAPLVRLLENQGIQFSRQ